MRLIDADALIEKTDCLFKDLNSTEDYMGIGYNHGVGDCIAIAKNIPTIEAEPVKTGKWIEVPQEFFAPSYKCSVCGEPPIVDLYSDWVFSNYCPNCGAKMEGAEE